MKNLALLLLFISSFTYGFCQEQSNYKTAISKLATFYNEGQYDSIWQLCAPQMQNALPLEKTQQFFSQLKEKYGQIQHSAYEKADGAAAMYSSAFEKGVMTVKIVLDGANKIAGLRMIPQLPGNLPTLTRNTTKLILPFNGEWTVIWGGDTRELNYHVESNAQKNAFDMLITDTDGKTHKTTGKSNDDYYAFGQPIIAPCDATVVLSVDGVKDNVPGEENPVYLTGNSVILKTKNNEYLVFAHFRQNSIKVKEGAEVKQGQQLGLCGNSGNSTEPHLHFHIQNVENMNVATGAKCYFDKLNVNHVLKTDYSPVKGDKISNVN